MLPFWAVSARAAQGACHALGEREAGLAVVEADVALWVGVAVG